MARSNADIKNALADAKRDVTFAITHMAAHNYYGRTEEARAKLSEAWNLIYDAHKIAEGGIKGELHT